jgi:hypothetical protein
MNTVLYVLIIFCFTRFTLIFLSETCFVLQHCDCFFVAEFFRRLINSGNQQVRKPEMMALNDVIICPIEGSFV